MRHVPQCGEFPVAWSGSDLDSGWVFVGVLVFGREGRRPLHSLAAGLLGLACTLLIDTTPLHATSFVLLSDADLVHTSDIIALGTVRAIATQATNPEEIETHVKLRVEEQVKGRRKRTVIFAIPGGTASGVRRVVFGAPDFWVGERVIVFLRLRPDGQLTPNGLSMGKFAILASPTGARAHRELGGAAFTFDATTRSLRALPREEDRSLTAFLEALRETAAAEPAPGDAASASHHTTPAAATRWGDAFTFLGPPPVRWVQPDSGQPITYLVDPGGDRDIGVAASQKAIADAFAAWSNAGSSARLLDSGSASPALFNACDGLSSIEFNDPFGEIGPPSHCAGVLAVGGYCSTSTQTTTVNGVTFDRITEGDLTVNDGFGGCAIWNATNLAEVLTHELGHTLGLGHSSENPQEPDPALRDATMYYLAHFDGRGASLRADDVAGVQTLYPQTVAAPSAFRTVQLRAFMLNPITTTLVLNAFVRFPNADFTPVRDRLTVSIRDSGGVLYSGTVPSFTVHPRSRGPVGYVGALTGPNGRGSAQFAWSHGTSASLVLRLSSPGLRAPASSQATVALTFGQQTFTQDVSLQPNGAGEWVLQ